MNIQAWARTAGRRKPVDQVVAEVGASGRSLRRDLGTRDLIFLGVGAVLGAGIFTSVGEMAAGGADHLGAGPALVVSYLLTALACGFAALCYAEIAALVPIAGSAYTYSYVALGELCAWIIGWDLIIEYAVGNIYVAQSFSEYLRAFLRGSFGLDFPAWLATDFQSAARLPEIARIAPRFFGIPVGVNLPAFLITALLTVVLVVGIRQSARLNAALVIGKLALVAIFIAAGVAFIEPANYTPFAPNGWPGIWAGASIAFFSYIGFDAISTAAEEVRHPQRDLPRAMIGTLVICAVLYVATAAVMTGLVPARELGVLDPLSHALQRAGLQKLSVFMAGGAVVAVVAVLLVFQLGQPRILMAMARDGLLPPVFARVHPRFRTPVWGTVATGTFVALAPSFITPAQAIELTNIGTLFAFALVSLGVIVLRVREPGRPRPFRCPGYPVTPVLSILSCLALMLGLPANTWLRFAIWLGLGGVVYLAYGVRRSRMNGDGAVGQGWA